VIEDFCLWSAAAWVYCRRPHGALTQQELSDEPAAAKRAEKAASLGS
jgi:hypothetical protein